MTREEEAKNFAARAAFVAYVNALAERLGSRAAAVEALRNSSHVHKAVLVYGTPVLVVATWEGTDDATRIAAAALEVPKASSGSAGEG